VAPVVYRAYQDNTPALVAVQVLVKEGQVVEVGKEEG